MSDTAETGVAWAAPVPEHYSEALWAIAVRRRRPRVVIKADLLPALSVASTVALLGLPLAWLWSRLAPPMMAKVFAGNQFLLLSGVESYHRFDDLAIFVLLGLFAGVLTGVAVWFLRERRGPVIMIAAVLGSLGAAWLAAHSGVSFAAGHYPLVTPALGAIIAEAPRLDSTWVLLIEPLGMALTYGALAAWNGLPDLGRRLG